MRGRAVITWDLRAVPTQREANLTVEVPGRWVRLFAAYGVPAGSHIGVWRTRGGFSGDLHGLNLRVGRRYVGPCLTVLAHTHPSRERTPS